MAGCAGDAESARPSSCADLEQMIRRPSQVAWPAGIGLDHMAAFQ